MDTPSSKGRPARRAKHALQLLNAGDILLRHFVMGLVRARKHFATRGVKQNLPVAARNFHQGWALTDMELLYSITWQRCAFIERSPANRQDMATE